MLNTNLKNLMINNDGFAFDPRTGHTFNINATGLLVINCLRAGAAVPEIVEQITEQFDVVEQTADRDLQAFMNELERQKLITAEVAS